MAPNLVAGLLWSCVRLADGSEDTLAGVKTVLAQLAPSLLASDAFSPQAIIHLLLAAAASNGRTRHPDDSRSTDRPSTAVFASAPDSGALASSDEEDGYEVDDEFCVEDGQVDGRPEQADDWRPPPDHEQVDKAWEDWQPHTEGAKRFKERVDLIETLARQHLDNLDF